MAAGAQTSVIAEAVTTTTAHSETSAVGNIFAPLDLTNTEDISLFRHRTNTASSMPIEVKRYFGFGNTGINDCLRNENFIESRPCLEAICRDIGRHNEANLWYALTQTAYYISTEYNLNNRGVMFSKDGIILMQRVNNDTVLVSDIIGYGNDRLHPVAAVAHWISVSIDNPSKALPLLKRVPPGAEEEATHLAMAIAIATVPARPGAESVMSQPQKRPRPRSSSHESDAPIAYNTRSRKGKERQHRRYEHDKIDLLTLGSSETVVAKD
ncbi:hypothetical protein EV175_001740 [Coemansia sp. RSA 1933]|nr:hypothetical protein EV175_001740 [Coemansia sp. RSA 1933]